MRSNDCRTIVCLLNNITNGYIGEIDQHGALFRLFSFSLFSSLLLLKHIFPSSFLVFLDRVLDYIYTLNFFQDNITFFYNYFFY
jgi:hypothetical protein